MFGKKKAKKTLSRVILTGLVCGSVLGYGGSAWAEDYTDTVSIDGTSLVLSGNDSVSVTGSGDRVRGFFVNNGGTLSNADGSVLSISVVNTSATTDSRADGIVLWNDNSVNPATNVTLYGLTGITATGMNARGIDVWDSSSAKIVGSGNANIVANASEIQGEALGVQVGVDIGGNPNVTIEGFKSISAHSQNGYARTFNILVGSIVVNGVEAISAYGGLDPVDPNYAGQYGLAYAVQGAGGNIDIKGNNTIITATTKGSNTVGIAAGWNSVVRADGIKSIMTAQESGTVGQYSYAAGIEADGKYGNQSALYLNKETGSPYADLSVIAPNTEVWGINANEGGILQANLKDVTFSGVTVYGLFSTGKLDLCISGNLSATATGSVYGIVSDSADSVETVTGTGDNVMSIAASGSGNAYGVYTTAGLVTLKDIGNMTVTSGSGMACAIYSTGGTTTLDGVGNVSAVSDSGSAYSVDALYAGAININGKDADSKTVITGDVIAQDGGTITLKNTAIVGNVYEAKTESNPYGTIKFLGTNTVDGAVTLQGNKSITAAADSYSLTQVGTDATDTITYNGDLSVSGTGTTVTIAGTNTAKASIAGKVTVGAGSALNLTNATVGTTVTNSGTAYLNNVTTTEGWTLADGSVTVIDTLINGTDLTAMSKTGTVNGAVYAPSGTLDVRGVDLRLKGEPNVFGGTPENPTTLDTLRTSRVLFGDIYDGSNNLTIKNIILENDTTAYRAALGVYYDSLTVDNISVNAPENWYWTQQYQNFNYQMYTGYGGTLTVNESLTTGEFMNASSSLGYTGILNLADGAVLNCVDFQNTGNVTEETLAAGTVHVNGARATLNAAALNNHAITTLGTVNITGHPVMCTKEQGLSNANYGTDAVLTIGTLNFNQVDTGAVKNYFRVGDNAVTTIGAMTSSAIGADFYVTGTSDSTVNKDGGKAVQYIGDIVFAKYSDSDSVGTKFSLNLDSSDDYFTGSVRGTTSASARWGKWGWPINDDAVASTDNIKGMTLNLSNGATWTMTGDSVVNNLTMDKATIAKDTSVHTLTLQGGTSSVTDSTVDANVVVASDSTLNLNEAGVITGTITNGGTLNLDGDLAKDIEGSGTTVLQADIVNVTESVSVAGTLDFGTGETKRVLNMQDEGKKTDTVLTIGKMKGNADLKFDVDLSNVASIGNDKLVINGVEGTPILNVTSVNVTKDVPLDKIGESHEVTYASGDGAVSVEHTVGGSAGGSITITNSFAYTFAEGTTKGTLAYTVAMAEVTFKKFIEGELMGNPAVLSLTGDMKDGVDGGLADVGRTAQANGTLTINLNSHSLGTFGNTFIVTNIGTGAAKTICLDGGTTNGIVHTGWNVAAGGTLAVSGNIEINGSITNAGAVTFAGTTTVAGNLDGAGSYTNSGNLSVVDASKLQMTNGLDNSGILNLGSGTLGSKVTGVGALNINGDVTTVAGNIATTGTNTVNNGKTLTITEGNLTGDVINNGTVAMEQGSGFGTVTGGSAPAKIKGGNVTLGENVTFTKDNLQDVTLTLNGATYNVTGVMDENAGMVLDKMSVAGVGGTITLGDITLSGDDYDAWGDSEYKQIQLVDTTGTNTLTITGSKSIATEECTYTFTQAYKVAGDSGSGLKYGFIDVLKELKDQRTLQEVLAQEDGDINYTLKAAEEVDGTLQLREIEGSAPRTLTIAGKGNRIVAKNGNSVLKNNNRDTLTLENLSVEQFDKAIDNSTIQGTINLKSITFVETGTMDVVNEGTLNILDDRVIFAKGVSGSGTMNLKGNLTVGKGVVIEQSNINGDEGVSLTNNGTVIINDGILNSKVQGGILEFAGETSAEKAEYIAGETNRIRSQAKLKLADEIEGELKAILEGDGEVIIDSAIDATGATEGGIQTRVTVNKDKSLTIYADKLGNVATNNGTLNLKGGTGENGRILGYAVGGTGKTVITGGNSGAELTVTANVPITSGGGIVIDQYNVLKTDVGNLGADVTNKGTIKLFGGTQDNHALVGRKITGGIADIVGGYFDLQDVANIEDVETLRITDGSVYMDAEQLLDGTTKQKTAFGQKFEGVGGVLNLNNFGGKETYTAKDYGDISGALGLDGGRTMLMLSGTLQKAQNEVIVVQGNVEGTTGDVKLSDVRPKVVTDVSPSAGTEIASVPAEYVEVTKADSTELLATDKIIVEGGSNFRVKGFQIEELKDRAKGSLDLVVTGGGTNLTLMGGNNETGVVKRNTEEKVPVKLTVSDGAVFNAGVATTDSTTKNKELEFAEIVIDGAKMNVIGTNVYTPTLAVGNGGWLVVDPAYVKTDEVDIRGGTIQVVADGTVFNQGYDTATLRNYVERAGVATMTNGDGFVVNDGLGVMALKNSSGSTNVTISKTNGDHLAITADPSYNPATAPMLRMDEGALLILEGGQAQSGAAGIIDLQGSTAEDISISDNAKVFVAGANAQGVGIYKLLHGEGVDPAGNYFGGNIFTDNALYKIALLLPEEQIEKTFGFKLTWNGANTAFSAENLGVTRGAHDVANMVTDAVATHFGNKEEGEKLWATFIHNKDKVDGLAMGSTTSQYDAQFNGTVIGYDLVDDKDITLGLALGYVNGNTTNSTGHNDSKYNSVEVYGRKKVGAVQLHGDITYLHGKNETEMTVDGTSIKADAKTNTYSVGVRAEMPYKVGKGTLTPFAGLRYIRISGKDYSNNLGMEFSTNNLSGVVLPLGVSYKTAVDNFYGWKVKPEVALGYAFNLGNRDGRTSVTHERVGSSYEFDVLDKGALFIKAGISVSRKNFTMGVGYDYMKSSNSRNNRWNVNLSWSF